VGFGAAAGMSDGTKAGIAHLLRLVPEAST